MGSEILKALWRSEIHQGLMFKSKAKVVTYIKYISKCIAFYTVSPNQNIFFKNTKINTSNSLCGWQI